MRILITGASGSGTSTLGRALAEVLHWPHFDCDDYYWFPTNPPFTTKRDSTERISLLLESLNKFPRAVVSGSIVDWGLELEDSFSLIVFLYVPAPIRVERLRKRELAQLGHADPLFLEWAAQYDEGRLGGAQFGETSAMVIRAVLRSTAYRGRSRHCVLDWTGFGGAIYLVAKSGCTAGLGHACAADCRMAIFHEDTKMNRRALASSLLAALFGVMALVVALAGSAFALQLIDPAGRISAFLSLPSHHPVQVAVATAAIYLTVGVFAGFLLRRVARAFDVQVVWLVSAFVVALAGSVAVAYAMHHASPLSLASSLLPHITILLLAAATVATMPRTGGVRAP